MSLKDIAVWVLLTIGVAAALLACLGMLVMTHFNARLHYVSLASVPAALALAAAVTVASGFSPATAKAIIAAVVIAVGSPAITHATARAGRVREYGFWSALPPESKDGSAVSSGPTPDQAMAEPPSRGE
jgi:multisubunit Na+/H+ antiporter MnhG subunit